MFRKSTINKQLDMFSSPAQMMGKRESNQYDDPNAWHNRFYREVTSKVDEDIFKPLFSDGKANGKDGRPNAPIRIIFAMRVLKEGCGCSDESLYEPGKTHIKIQRLYRLNKLRIRYCHKIKNILLFI